MSGQRGSGMSPGRRGFGTAPPEIRPGPADREAVRELYRDTAPAAYGLALRILRRRGSAEEVVREGFQRLAASQWITAGTDNAPVRVPRHDLATPWGRSAFVANEPRTDLGVHPGGTDRAGGFDEDRAGSVDRRDDDGRWVHSVEGDRTGGPARSSGFDSSGAVNRSNGPGSADRWGRVDDSDRYGNADGRGHGRRFDETGQHDQPSRLDDEGRPDRAGRPDRPEYPRRPDHAGGRPDYASLHDPRLGFARRDAETGHHSRAGRMDRSGRGDYPDSCLPGGASLFDGTEPMPGAGRLVHAGLLDVAGHPDTAAPVGFTDPRAEADAVDTPAATGTRYAPTLHTRLLAQVHRLAIQRLRLDRNDRIDIPWLAASARLGFDPLDSRCEVFVLAYYGGRTYRSIARELGMRVPAVTRLLAEGIERLAHQRLVRVAARRPWTPPGSVLALADAYALDAVAELEHHHIENKLATTTTTGLAQFDARVGGVHELLAQLAADDRQPPPRTLEQRVLAAVDSQGRRGARAGRPPWLPRFGV